MTTPESTLQSATPALQGAPSEQETPPAEPPSNVTRLEYEGRELHLIGTAHISQQSVVEVTRVIRELKPQTVCVELDAGRFAALTDGNRFRKLDLRQIIRERKQLFVLSNLALTSFQRRLGDKLGVKPGAEMLAAVQTAEEVGAQLVLADRDVRTTLLRCWSQLGPLNRAQLGIGLAASFFSKQDISAEQVEELKGKDTIGELMREFARQMPELQMPLIEERDQYLMSNIQEAPGARVVGVVGAAHVGGMVQVLGKAVDRSRLNELPQPSVTARIRPWFIPLIVIASWATANESLNDLLQAWVLPCSLGAALGGAVFGASPFTLFAVVATAPFVALNPLARKGQLASRIEAWWRKPSPDDCAKLDTALTSFSGLYTNRFSGVLLVTLGVQVGGALGAWVGACWVLLKAWS